MLRTAVVVAWRWFFVMEAIKPFRKVYALTASIIYNLDILHLRHEWEFVAVIKDYNMATCVLVKGTDSRLRKLWGVIVNNDYIPTLSFLHISLTITLIPLNLNGAAAHKGSAAPHSN